MPTLIHKNKPLKDGSIATHWYIVENRTIDGKQYRERLRTLGVIGKKDAERKFHKFLDGDQSPDNIYFMKVADEFLKHYASKVVQKGQTSAYSGKQSGVSLSTYNMALNSSKRLKEYFKTRHLDEINFVKIEEYKIHLRKKYKLGNVSINVDLRTLRKILTYALHDDKLKVLPRMIEEPEVYTAENIEIFSWKELRAIMKHLQQRLKEDHKKAAIQKMIDYMRFMLKTGCRPREYTDLKRKDIDFKNKTIIIRSDNPHKPGRTIELPQLNSVVHSGTDERVCPYLSAHSAAKAFKKISDILGIDIYPYKFRKTYITWHSRKKDANLWLVACYTGTSVEVIKDHYAKPPAVIRIR